MPVPDIDQILEAVRVEARARGSRGRIGIYPSERVPPEPPAATHGTPVLELQHVADFLPLPLDAFVESAYRHVLGRPADAAGAAHYQRALLRGRLTRVEVLGRLAYSPEGRACRARLPGLPVAFVAATLYRVPVLGPLAALLSRALRLPAHWQDRSGIEAAGLASGSWVRR